MSSDVSLDVLSGNKMTTSDGRWRKEKVLFIINDKSSFLFIIIFKSSFDFFFVTGSSYPTQNAKSDVWWRVSSASTINEQLGEVGSKSLCCLHLLSF